MKKIFFITILLFLPAILFAQAPADIEGLAYSLIHNKIASLSGPNDFLETRPLFYLSAENRVIISESDMIGYPGIATGGGIWNRDEGLLYGLSFISHFHPDFTNLTGTTAGGTDVAANTLVFPLQVDFLIGARDLLNQNEELYIGMGFYHETIEGNFSWETAYQPFSKNAPYFSVGTSYASMKLDFRMLFPEGCDIKTVLLFFKENLLFHTRFDILEETLKEYIPFLSITAGKTSMTLNTAIGFGEDSPFQIEALLGGSDDIALTARGIQGDEKEGYSLFAGTNMKRLWLGGKFIFRFDETSPFGEMRIDTPEEGQEGVSFKFVVGLHSYY